MLLELLASPYAPLVIFCMRVTDVTLDTVRVLLMVRNAKWQVPLIGFVQVSIWVVAVTAVVQNLNSPLHLIGYSGGFATGNYVGMLVEERLALGLATMNTMVRHGGRQLATALRERGFAVTEMDGRGKDGPVEVLYSVISRRKVAPYIAVVEHVAPDSFLVVEEPRTVRGGSMFPGSRP
jgi:uncharacterized protein YebE (UPF0316 family)